MEALFEAKGKLDGALLWSSCDQFDCDWMKRHMSSRKAKLSYSTIDSSADLYAKILGRYDWGSEVEVHFQGVSRKVKLPLLGSFNVSNVLCALGMALSGDENSLDDYFNALENLKAPKGRLENIPCRAKGRVIVDYAHTPDALESVLKTMKGHVEEGKLKVLFGCGGNRDKAKRAVMGEVVAKWADSIYLTSDNPRFEEPEEIMSDIEVGLKTGGVNNYDKVISRQEAILRALSELEQMNS